MNKKKDRENHDPWFNYFLEKGGNIFGKFTEFTGKNGISVYNRIDLYKIEEEEKMIYAKVNGNVLTIKPENNSSADAFIKMLEGGDVTVKMHDYGGFEKVGPLGNTLPTNDAMITTSPGDVILYQGDQITVYYGVNTWSFTLLGKVQGMSRDELRSALGLYDTEITFSIKKSAGTE